VPDRQKGSNTVEVAEYLLLRLKRRHEHEHDGKREEQRKKDATQVARDMPPTQTANRLRRLDLMARLVRMANVGDESGHVSSSLW
jgi:hypothetical protein